MFCLVVKCNVSSQAENLEFHIVPKMWMWLVKFSALDYISSINNSQALFLNFQSSILHKTTLIHPQFAILHTSSSICAKRSQIFYSKYPQNSGICDKMSTSTANSFWGWGTILYNQSQVSFIA